jgi:hypothetical protein
MENTLTDVEFKTFTEIENVLSELENRDERDVKFDTFSVNIRRDDLKRNGTTFYAFYSISSATSKGKTISDNIVDIKVTEEHGVRFSHCGSQHENGKDVIFKYIDILEHSKIFIKSAEKVINNEYLEREFG